MAPTATDTGTDTDSSSSISHKPLVPNPIEAVLAERRRVAEDVDLFTFTRHGAGLPPWSPGAHIDVDLAQGLVRQYSLCGDPDADHYQVAVLLEESGRGGSRLIHETLVEGSHVTISAPRNNFPLVPSPRYLFIAGGIGITPILPMINRAVAQNVEWRLIYGGRTRASMAFLDRLRMYGDRVDVRPQDEYGLLDLDATLARPEPDTLVYCCGPEGLLSAVESRCASWPHGSLHIERFSAATSANQHEPGRDRPFTVHFSTSGRSGRVAPGQSIVDVAEECGVNLPASCFEGVCGTCETRVLAGRPDHRDSLLSEEERDSGQTLLACVSRCLDDELHLDI